MICPGLLHLPTAPLKTRKKVDMIKKITRTLYHIYFGIGIAAMGILTASMIFSVIARYLFSLSWKQLTEFNVTTFAFTTFWGMGLCILNNEHVIIDIFYDKVPPHLKRWLTIFNYGVALVVDIVFTIYAYKYTIMAGIQISQGMEIPMKYMYGIMPVSGLICAVCIIYKIVECIKAPVTFFAAKNIVITNEVPEKNQGE